ncbi:uncharacterized protein LOC127243241 [Andrographis paniculata]|uniref:uncharacterized protein LOC127243241 n=1 Tax=Andrographis paniculata TaxID=175694 RepID=UPI0021E8A04E|nr:uncharacterized protein LOC127243241 [Andrographis paniculata]
MENPLPRPLPLPLPRPPQLSRSKSERPPPPPPTIWDCGSSLYDSFEVKSFQQHLHSAMGMGMGMAVPEKRLKPPATKLQLLTRSLRTLFTKKSSSSSSSSASKENAVAKDRFSYYVFYDKASAGALSAIPEDEELDRSGAPGPGPLRRMASERVPAHRTSSSLLHLPTGIYS